MRVQLDNPVVTDFVKETVEFEDRIADELLAHAGVLELRVRVEVPPELIPMVRRFRANLLSGKSVGPSGQAVATELSAVISERYAETAEAVNRKMFEDNGLKVPGGISMRPIPMEVTAVQSFVLNAFLSELQSVDKHVADLLAVESGMEG